MIMTVAEFRAFVTTDLSDDVLTAKLSALELLIRKYTNNNFQVRSFRARSDISSDVLSAIDAMMFHTGDTIQITESEYNEGLYVIDSVSNGEATLEETGLIDEPNVLVTKVVYPLDVKLGVTNMLEWDINNRDKVGVQSETISRHSVTYFNMDGDNAVVGYPKSLVGFLKPYQRARF